MIFHEKNVVFLKVHFFSSNSNVCFDLAEKLNYEIIINFSKSYFSRQIAIFVILLTHMNFHKKISNFGKQISRQIEMFVLIIAK